MLKVNLVNSTYYCKNNFKGQIKQENEQKTLQNINEAYEKGQRTGFLNGAALSLLCLIASIGGYLSNSIDRSNQNESFMKDVEKTYNKKDINKDSFVVSDINHDGTPDVLLTSNNGKVFTLIDFQDLTIKELTKKDIEKYNK